MEFAENGHIVQRLDDPTGAVVSYISEVLDTGSSLYLGSYTSPFLAKLSLEWILFSVYLKSNSI